MTILVQLGAHYFACGVPGHCSKGMRAKIEVAAACSGNIWEIKLFNIWVLQLKHLYLSVFVSFMCICLFVCLCIFHCHHRILKFVFLQCFLSLHHTVNWSMWPEKGEFMKEMYRLQSVVPAPALQGGGNTCSDQTCNKLLEQDWNSSILCLDNFYQKFS